jgi:hypothetical protein
VKSSELSSMHEDVRLSLSVYLVLQPNQLDMKIMYIKTAGYESVRIMTENKMLGDACNVPNTISHIR